MTIDQAQLFRHIQAAMLARMGGIGRTLDMTKLPAEPMVRGLTPAQWRAVTTRAPVTHAATGKGAR